MGQQKNSGDVGVGKVEGDILSGQYEKKNCLNEGIIRTVHVEKSK
jgi:hypothetical protein